MYIYIYDEIWWYLYIFNIFVSICTLVKDNVSTDPVRVSVCRFWDSVSCEDLSIETEIWEKIEKYDVCFKLSSTKKSTTRGTFSPSSTSQSYGTQLLWPLWSIHVRPCPSNVPVVLVTIIRARFCQCGQRMSKVDVHCVNQNMDGAYASIQSYICMYVYIYMYIYVHNYTYYV